MERPNSTKAGKTAAAGQATGNVQPFVGVKPGNKWRICPGSPFKAQAFVQPESNIARFNSGR